MDLAQQHLANSAQLTLPLEHSGESSEVRLEPILLAIALDRFAQIGNHCIDVVFELGHFAARLDFDGAREVPLSHRRGHLRDRTNLAGEVRSKKVDVTGEVPPGPGGAGDVCLSTETAFDTDLTRDIRHLIGKRCESVGHIVDRVGEGGDLALRLHGEALIEITIGHCGYDLDDPADLLGQVVSHEIDVVSEIFPGAADACDLCLAAKLALSADLVRHATDLAGESVKLVDHRIDGILQLQELAFDVDRDLALEITARHGSRDLGDVADLRSEVAAHGVDGVGQVLPSPRHTRNDRLHAEPALRADLARDACHLRGETIELIDHRVDGVLQRENFALHIDLDLAREISLRDSGCHLGDVADLGSQVRRHLVDAVCEGRPGASHAGHDSLTAQAAVGADLTGHAGDLRSKRSELVHHRVDGFLELQNLPTHVDSDFLGQVAVGDSDGNLCDVADLRRQIAGHLGDGFGELLPHTRHTLELSLATKLALGADLAGHAGNL